MMPHITLSIPEDLYEEMKKHPEVRWSEVARRAIVKYLLQLKSRSSSEEVLSLLSRDARNKLASVSEDEARRFYEKVVEAEWKRMRSLTRTS